MRFGPVPLDEAGGAILAHSLRLGRRVLKKGTVISPADLAALQAEGIGEVVVARLDDGDADENAAATRVAAALAGPDPAARGLRLTPAQTGRVNLYATQSGILRLDPEAIAATNGVHSEITVATLRPWSRAVPGTMLATVKVISYAVPVAAVEAAERAAAAGAGFGVCAPELRDVTLILTGVTQAEGAKAIDATRGRLDALGVEGRLEIVTVPHDEAQLAQALGRAPGELLLILTVASTADVHDVGPAALRLAGGTVERFGMPVDPGNLLFLGRLGARPVVGLPGCARSPARNGADWVIDRLICGVPVSSADIAAMGVGGLLKEGPDRPRPRAG